MQICGTLFVLDLEFLLLVDKAKSPARREYDAATSSSKPLTFVASVHTLQSPALATLDLPEDVQLFRRLVAKQDKSIQPYNALLARWQEEGGVGSDLAWDDVGRTLMHFRAAANAPKACTSLRSVVNSSDSRPPSVPFLAWLAQYGF